MKSIFCKPGTAVIAALLFAPVIHAQVEQEKAKSSNDGKHQANDIQHYTITKKGDSKEKITVVIDGEKITVNGKPIEELKDGDITVNKMKFKSGNNLARTTAPGAFAWGDANGAYSLFSGNENRAMLGVVTEKVEEGVKVQEITKESAAEKAGLKEGDIITKIDDKKIESPDELSKAITAKKPGEKVNVTYLRDKKENKAAAELTKWKGVSAYSFTPGQPFEYKIPEMDLRELEIPRVQTMPRVYGQAYNWNGGQPKLGLSVQDTDDGKGVKVIDVDEESNAAKAGVKKDDIVTHVNDKEVNSADEVAKLVKENKDKPNLRLQVKRNGKSQNIEVKMPRKLKTADL